MKIILICLTVLACTGMFIYFSPYQTFMRECIYDENFNSPIGKDHCTWLYNEFRKVKPITQLYYLKCE